MFRRDDRLRLNKKKLLFEDNDFQPFKPSYSVEKSKGSVKRNRTNENNDA